MPEEEANSGFSHDEGEIEGDGADGGSSGDETSAPNTASILDDNPSGSGPRKRKRVKYQKTS
jgi:hypothetical protein